MRKPLLLAILMPAMITSLAFFSKEKPKPFHTEAELLFFRQQQPAAGQLATHGAFIPVDSNVLFPTSKLCSGCHGKDSLERAMVTTGGVDVNVYDDWRSSIMANSAKDPFWRAKVSHEILVNPAHSLDLQDKCTSCHAPSGHYQAKLKDHAAYYTLDDVRTDSLGLDGVTCQICHAQSPKQLGELFSGQLNFDTNNIRVAYGPYEFIFAPPMQQFAGVTPKYGPHINDAGLCAGCHTLITQTVDNNGQYTGNTFVEQATYHEWLNSRYADDQDNVTCQGCHLPQLYDEIIIAANYQFLTPKSPYGLHEMAGANTAMLNIMKQNAVLLDIDALPEHFDSSIAATFRMLQQKTLDLALSPNQLSGDTARFTLRLHNRAGHKFPSGYPARRAWVEFIAISTSGDTLFHSGATDPDYRLVHEDTEFEPHHQVISSPDQVQIYEQVSGDVNGKFTNVLERGYLALKDNRLTPEGFKTTHPVYDTTTIVGHALTDPDFNRNPITGAEGSGSDELFFHIPVGDYKGYVRVEAHVWYQSMPRKWLDPMFVYASPEIDAFRNMFFASDNRPVLVARQVIDSLWITSVSAKQENKPHTGIYPSLSDDGRVSIQTHGVPLLKVQAWDLSGRLVWNDPQAVIQLPEQPGVYIVVVETKYGIVRRKVVVQ